MYPKTLAVARSLTTIARRNNYAAAKLQGLEEDLSLNDQQYQTGLSILFVGYILMMTCVFPIHCLRKLHFLTEPARQTVQLAAELCRTPIAVSRILRVCLGSSVGSDQPGQGLWWHRRLPFHYGFRR